MASRTLESKRDSLCCETRRLEITQVLPAVKMGGGERGRGREEGYLHVAGRGDARCCWGRGGGRYYHRFRKKGKPLKEME